MLPALMMRWLLSCLCFDDKESSACRFRFLCQCHDMCELFELLLCTLTVLLNFICMRSGQGVVKAYGISVDGHLTQQLHLGAIDLCCACGRRRLFGWHYAQYA